MGKLSVHVHMSFSLFLKNDVIGKEAHKFNSAFIIIIIFFLFCVHSSEKTISSVTTQQFNNHASGSMTTKVIQ